MKIIKWDPKISAGNILTVISIALSVVALLISAGQDRDQRERELANKKRTAAAAEIVKLEQWKQLSQLYFQDIQSPIVEATQKYADTSFNKEVTRDYLWKVLDEKRSQYYDKKLQENITTVYVDLYGYHTNAGQLSLVTIREVQDFEQEMFEKVQIDTQDAILNYNFEGKYSTADLGNRLRGAVYPIQKEFTQKMGDDIDCLEDVLMSLMREEDATIYDKSEELSSIQPCHK